MMEYIHALSCLNMHHASRAITTAVLHTTVHTRGEHRHTVHLSGDLRCITCRTPFHTLSRYLAIPGSQVPAHPRIYPILGCPLNLANKHAFPYARGNSPSQVPQIYPILGCPLNLANSTERLMLFPYARGNDLPEIP